LTRCIGHGPDFPFPGATDFIKFYLYDGKPPAKAAQGTQSTTMPKQIALVQNIETRKTRNDDNFWNITVNLGAEGAFRAIPAKAWGSDQFLKNGKSQPAKGDVVEFDYKADEFQGRPQWKIQDYRILGEAERKDALPNFVPQSNIRTEFYRAKLEELLEEADSSRVTAQVLFDLFDRVGFREAFLSAPAAAMHHQSYAGGLLEHTINVTVLALGLAEAYSPVDDGTGREGLSINSMRLPVDRTLLISAGLLHDIGKIDTYSMQPMADVTDSNRFEGHLAISYALVREAAAPLLAEPPYEGARDELDKLFNCVLSHHGQLEYGSPVLPACVEAFSLSQADLTDARISSIVEAGNADRGMNPETRWTRPPHYRGGMFIGDWPNEG